MNLMRQEMSEHRLRWGRYKGVALKDIPDDYFKWILENKPGILRGRTLVYIKTRLNMPMDKYKVTVRYSLESDGTYIVEGYTEKHAIHKCMKENKVRCTQSYHGTEIGAEKL